PSKRALPAEQRRGNGRELPQAAYLSLAWRQASPAAEALCNDLRDQVTACWAVLAKPEDPSRRPEKIRRAIEGFAGALVASLRCLEPRPPLYRSWMAASFSASAPTAVSGIGYRTARAVRDALIGLRFLEEVTPHRFDVWICEPGQEQATRLLNEAATYLPARRFAALVGVHGGIEHCRFRPTMPAWPLVLHWAKRPGSRSTKARRPIGLPRKVRQSPIVSDLVQELRQMNNYLDGFSLTKRDGTPAFFGLHRIFALPVGYDLKRLDLYQWDVHGRIYARGGGPGYGPYQCIGGDERLQLVVDGEVTAELDIRASWPTIAYGLTRSDQSNFAPNRWEAEDADPYDGITDLATDQIIPRDVIKAASSIFLTNSGAHLRRWPSQTVQTFEDRFLNLRETYPAAHVGRALLAARPHLACWKSMKRGNGMVLMNLEARMLMAVSKRAMAAGIPGWPVHDALLVPESQSETVRQMILDEFFQAFGAIPHVRIKLA
ncbi:MAG TPA: hypothetical protein VHL31_04660, partial [Geminicoccus sp.]|uniref:hypothetical protein n=1 Tax=Geminicoccus sp. TaxID=2024832 RepID=UPI002E366925